MVAFDGDVFRLVHPSWVIGKELLRTGPHFLWDSYREMGMPYLASPPNQALYPFRIIFSFLNYLDYQRLFVVTHVLALSGFAFGLFWTRYREWRPALGAALAMGFNGYLCHRATANIDFAALTWVPGLLLCLDLKRPVWLGILLTLQLFSGYPTFCILSGLLLLIYSLTHDDLKATFICLIKGYVLALGLGAIQYLPFLEMLKESNRPLFYSPQWALEFSLHPVELIRALFVPSFWVRHLPSLSTSDPLVTGFYEGPILTILFFLGLFRGNRRVRIVALGSMIGFTLCLGHFIGFYRFIPLITVFRFPAHWLLIANFCFVIVAIEGLRMIKRADVQIAVIAVLALDFLVYAWPAHCGWGDMDFFEQTPIRVMEVKRPSQGHRIYHDGFFMSQLDHKQIGSQEEWLSMFRLAVPSIGVSYGMHEVTSRHPLSGRRQEAYVRRLMEAEPASALYDFAGIERTVSLKEAVPSGFNIKKDNIIVRENPNPKPHCFMWPDGVVDVQQETPGRFVLTAKGPGKLVVSESYYPGWHGSLDGRSVPVILFEDMFLSLDVPPGSHTVVLVYRPASFIWGAIISLLTCFLLVGGWMFRWFKVVLPVRSAHV